MKRATRSASGAGGALDVHSGRRNATRSAKFVQNFLGASVVQLFSFKPTASGDGGEIDEKTK